MPRKALLASRIREAYDTDRTSVARHASVKGEDFTDVLTEVGYHLDVRRAGQGPGRPDRGRTSSVLDVLHRTSTSRSQQTEELHASSPASRRRQLDSQLKELADVARSSCAASRPRPKTLLAAQQAAVRGDLQQNKAKLAAMLAAAKKARAAARER